MDAGALGRLAVLREVLPVGEAAVERHGFDHVGVFVDDRDHPPRQAVVVAEQAVGIGWQDHDFGRRLVDGGGEGLAGAEEHAGQGQHQEAGDGERDDGREIAPPFIDDRGKSERHGTPKPSLLKGGSHPCAKIASLPDVCATGLRYCGANI
ncbi:MAG: hypothetical protein WDN06_00210 [Asticcacaulis sp.]